MGVEFERIATDCGQSKTGDGLSRAEFLVNRDESRRLQPTGMTGEVAIAQSGRLAQLDKLLSLAGRQCGEDFQSTRICNQCIERHVLIIGRCLGED